MLQSKQLWLEAEVSRYVVPDPRHGTGAPDSTIAVLNQGGKANGGGPGLIVSPSRELAQSRNWALNPGPNWHDGTSQRKS
ncbi:hypothetical protein CABS01_11366 [Colletotrichum abscissum]|uniref:Uncharacterized protein n=1 Tax=Colletotrichum abscissum TaxID=1671311 RepID=A0A9Q0B3X1_9PEZI|nr:uncharacterized protein CABS01_11366 [Colletotrichum abscissum]KAI3551092.1 hypothetical protein CABS02_07435 [Colletotrichum abscissum]KAK1494350.1 hypothetical protein CABS01_11366 [Colletotrichum abscissum]